MTSALPKTPIDHLLAKGVATLNRRPVYATPNEPRGRLREFEREDVCPVCRPAADMARWRR